MAPEIADFEKADLKFLKDLKFVYEAFNPNFVRGLYGAYIPLGVLIVQVVTCREPIKKSAFRDDEFTLYAKYVNWEYFKVANLFKRALMDGLTLFDQRHNTPFPHTELMKHIEKLDNGLDDNFAGILGLHVAYDEILKALENMSGISHNDPNIRIIRAIKTEMKKPNFELQPIYHTNDIVYEPVKDCVISDTNSLDGLRFYQSMENTINNSGTSPNYPLFLSVILEIKKQGADINSDFPSFYKFIRSNSVGIADIKTAGINKVICTDETTFQRTNLQDAFDRLSRKVREQE